MDKEGKNLNTIDSKLKTTFTVFAIFVLMAAITIVLLGINVPSQSQESTQKKQLHISDTESPIPKLVGLADELESQEELFLEKTKTATNESQEEQQESEPNHFSGLNCNELSDIASSFEDG